MRARATAVRCFSPARNLSWVFIPDMINAKHMAQLVGPLFYLRVDISADDGRQQNIFSDS